jgi:hypothetical protein
MTEKRKLAAILAADVVGFSRLTGSDEEGTLARLRTLWSDLIAPTISVHNGRVVKRTGDGSIIEFRSVVDAVRCAIEVQNGMVERNAGLPPERRIEFRVDIHLGDVVEESDGDLMGDGVNIAARLEGIAKPGAICLSEQAYLLDHVVGAHQDRLGDCQPERLGGLEIDGQHKFRRLLDRDIGGLYPAQNLIGQFGGAPPQIGKVWSVGDQTSRFDNVPISMHVRQPGGERQYIDAGPVAADEWVGTDIECFCAAVERFERGRYVLATPDFQPNGIETERASCCLHSSQLQADGWIREIPQDCQPVETRDNFTQEFESLTGGIG